MCLVFHAFGIALAVASGVGCGKGAPRSLTYVAHDMTME